MEKDRSTFQWYQDREEIFCKWVIAFWKWRSRRQIRSAALGKFRNG